MYSPSESHADRRWVVPAVTAAIVIGALLRLWQFSSGPSLWLDELAVALNVMHQPLDELLFAPLEYGQMAPVGFLAVGRLFASIAPGHDWVFRVEPLVSSILTIPLMFLLARHVVGVVLAVVTTTLVASSPAMIALGSVAKPYAGDVFVCAALMYGALLVLSGKISEPKALAWVSLLGGILLFFSFPAVLVAFVFGVAIAGAWLVERRPGWRRRLLAFGIPIGLCAAAVAAISLRARSPEIAEYMEAYWAVGFPQSLTGVPRWAVEQPAKVYEATLLTAYPWQGVHKVLAVGLLGLGVIGTIAFLRERNWKAFVVLAPVGAALAASVLHFYPLSRHLSAFLTPSVAVLSVVGAFTLGDIVKRLSEPLALLAYSACILPTLFTLVASDLPYLDNEHTRPLIQQLAAELRPSDAVYSYYGANRALEYYGNRFGISDWRTGTCAIGNPRAYLEEIDTFRGVPRVWVVFTHVLRRYGESELILGYLRTIGSQKTALLDQMGVSGTSAYLFDLSDRSRLERATASSYDLGPEIVVDPRLRCGVGPVSDWTGPERQGSVRHE